MTVCKCCGKIGGYHMRWCSSRFEHLPAPVKYRIEWTGNLKNYIPVKESK